MSEFDMCNLKKGAACIDPEKGHTPLAVHMGQVAFLVAALEGKEMMVIPTPARPIDPALFHAGWIMERGDLSRRPDLP